MTPLGRFVLRFLLIQTTLLLAWPIQAPWFPAAFRATGDILVAPLFASTDAHVAFSPYRGDQFDVDSKALLASRTTNAGRILPVDSHAKGYLCLSLMASLVLASGLERRRTLRVLALSVGLVWLWTALRLALAVTHALSREQGFAVIELGADAESALQLAYRVVYKSSGLSWGIVLAIWAWTCLPAVLPRATATPQAPPERNLAGPLRTTAVARPGDS